jgi:non-heme chloroperoxidase
MARVIEERDLADLTLIGHSMGCNEIARYLTRYGSGRVARAVLLAPTLPFVLKTADNPNGIPREMFDAVRAEWKKDFPRWVTDNAPPFFVPETSPAMMEVGIRLLTEIALPVALACNLSLITTDFRAELPRIDVPVLLLHGDKDVSAPLALTGVPTATLLKRCTLKVYEGAPHGLMYTHMDRVHADVLEFLKG